MTADDPVRHLAVMVVSVEHVVRILAGERFVPTGRDRVPRDAVVRSMMYDIHIDALKVLLEHPSFAAVAPHQAVPYISPQFVLVPPDSDAERGRGGQVG